MNLGSSVAGREQGVVLAKKAVLPMGDAALLSTLAAKAARFSKAADGPRRWRALLALMLTCCKSWPAQIRSKQAILKGCTAS